VVAGLISISLIALKIFSWEKISGVENIYTTKKKLHPLFQGLGVGVRI
jgi:hypothetical protein